MSATQNARVLDLLRRGPLNPVDLEPPNVIDGYAPVLRLAARIRDLKKLGHEISSKRQSNGTATYTLVRECAERGSSERTETSPVCAGSPTAAVSLGDTDARRGSGDAPPSPEPLFVLEPPGWREKEERLTMMHDLENEPEDRAA